MSINTNKTTLASLPNELWHEVVDYLGARELSALRLTCQFLNQIIEPVLWKSVVLQLGGNDSVIPPAINDGTSRHVEVGMTLTPKEYWKIHKVFGLERSTQMFGHTRVLHVAAPMWRRTNRDSSTASSSKDGSPQWYANDGEHVDWFINLIPLMFTNVQCVTYQLFDFRPENTSWVCDSGYLLGLFSSEKVYKHVEVVYRANLRLHAPLGRLDCDTLHLNLTCSPITHMEMARVSPRVHGLVIDTIPRNKVYLTNAHGTFTNSSIAHLTLNCVIDPNLSWAATMTKLEKLALYDTNGVDINEQDDNQVITLPRLKHLTVHVSRWNFIEQLDCPNLQSLCIVDRKQLVKDLPSGKLMHLQKRFTPHNNLKLYKLPETIQRQLHQVWPSM